ncbi:hypothetical protein OJAV_G00113700 [Oryzias javanicus]|uniref:Homeobox domain-containing protein n=1 Tax=Oryzias javanicus TaxID=123683 RepID=A0A437CWW3_ORYJA|nr:hypothetical protein OJAV_G00113700 [Oryzias javanicus]
MSSRRKSSNPCMVRVISDLPDEQDDPEEVTDLQGLSGKVLTEKEQSESTEKGESPQQVNSDQQTFVQQAENQHPEPSRQEEFGEGQQPPVIEEVEARGAKDKGETESDQVSQKKPAKGYECKYCPFLTHNLNDFKGHVDSNHPNVILNPMYLCAVCNFNTKKFDSLTEHNESQHPGETHFKFKRVKMNNQTILEQTIEGKDNSAECETTNEKGEKDSTSVFAPCVSTTVKSPGNVQSLFGGSEPKSRLDSLIQPNQITAVNINGTVIIPEPTMLQGLSHVTPMLQRPPNFNSVPKIAVPLNTTKYNPSLDDNLTLMASFNKFPYPTHAELSWLTAASKHPEEQIKVWFTTQRLKQGITWSPEEVEEARKKMFNGSIPPAHHTFTVLPTSPISESSSKSSKQPIVYTTVECPGQVRTTVSNGSSVVTTTYSSTGVVNGSSRTLKRSLPTHLTSVCGPESKRPIMAVAPHPGDPKDKVLMAPPPPPPPQKDRFQMATPAVRMETKRIATTPLGFPADVSKLTEPQGVDLKASYPRGDKVPSRLAEANGTSHLDGKWSHGQMPCGNNNGIVHLDNGDTPVTRKSDFHQKSSVMTQFPLLERMKGKTAKQLKILEENFLRNSFPTQSDVDNLAVTTGLSHQEIESWFGERRALRDNLEQALLNSMGTKRVGIACCITESKLNQQHRTLQLNGIHKTSTTLGSVKSPPPPAPPGAVLPSIPKPNSCLVPPESQSLALLKDDFPQTQWPSLEEFSQLEGQMGLPRSELSRWFTDTRLQSSGVELKELFHKNGLNGMQGQPVSALENTPSSIIQACQDGAVTNNSSKVLEMELGWLMDQRYKHFSSQQHAELQDRFAGRLRQQSAAELKNGVQNWGVMGGARDMFGSWLEDGRFRRGRELLLDRDRKMAEETSGRLTG